MRAFEDEIDEKDDEEIGEEVDEEIDEEMTLLLLNFIIEGESFLYSFWNLLFILEFFWFYLKIIFICKKLLSELYSINV